MKRIHSFVLLLLLLHVPRCLGKKTHPEEEKKKEGQFKSLHSPPLQVLLLLVLSPLASFSCLLSFPLLTLSSFSRDER